MTSRPEIPRRFFLCRTPLQALIIQQIQARAPGNDTVFYSPTSPSVKHAHYFDRLTAARRVFAPFRYPLNSHLAAETYQYLSLPADVRRGRYDEMYVASIGSFAFAALAGRNVDAAIMTFDDGTFNLRRSHFDAWIKDEGPVHHRMFRSVLSALSNGEIMARANRHYTIFDPSLSLFPEKEVVRLQVFRDAEPTEGVGAQRRLVIVLGTPIHLVAPQKAELYRQYVAALSPDLYIPHPAETDRLSFPSPLQNDAEITQHLDKRIAEEIIWLLRSRGHSLEIHGFGSTALINVASMGDAFNHLVKGEDPEQTAVFARFGIASDCPF